MVINVSYLRYFKMVTGDYHMYSYVYTCMYVECKDRFDGMEYALFLSLLIHNECMSD